MNADERHEAADALDTLIGIDEGEHLDTDRLEHLSRRLREAGDNDSIPEWLREMLGPKDDEERRQRRLDLIAEVISLREYKAQTHETMQLLSEAGKHHIVATEALRQALGSLLDVVDELCMGLAVGQEPDRPWAESVSETFSEHRKTLGFGGPE